MILNPNPNLMGFLLFSLFLFSLLHSSHQAPKPFYNPINPRLERAYIALQAWKHSMTCDPNGLTTNWVGPHVCSYTGVFCAPAPDDPHLQTVASIDLNHGGICGTLSDHLGLLTDLAVFHVNSNKFCGTIPETFGDLKLLYELDLSNNQFSGFFPLVPLRMPSLKYFDIRYNNFKGGVPKELFDMKFDAIFLNNNKFKFTIPENIGNSTVSVLVLANLGLRGCLPRSIGNMRETLHEVLLSNNSLSSCLPEEIGNLKNATVLDISSNNFVGPLPESIGNMKSLEQLDVSHNMLSGEIPESICELPRLKNFTLYDNYFNHEPEICSRIATKNDRYNCIPYRPLQRPEDECHAFLSQPVHCPKYGCFPPKVWRPSPASSPSPFHY